MASAGGVAGGLAAFAASMASNFGFSGRAVFAKMLKREHPKSQSARSDISLFYHISWMGLVLLLPLAVVSESSTLRAAFGADDFDALQFVVVILLNGVMYTSYNQFSFLVLSRVSTATHAVLNVCRRVCVIGVTTIIFGSPLSLINGIGISIAVCGMLWFTYTKTSGGTTNASSLHNSLLQVATGLSNRRRSGEFKRLASRLFGRSPCDSWTSSRAGARSALATSVHTARIVELKQNPDDGCTDHSA